MSKLLRNRWLHRALFAGVLIALGVGIYRVTPPEAMCEIEGTEPLVLSEDGRRLVTLSAGVGECKGPFHVWDTRSAEKISSHFTHGDGFQAITYSRDGRFIAGQIHKVLAVDEARLEKHRDAIVLLDLINDTVREIPLVDTDSRLVNLQFSPAGDALVRFAPWDAKALRIYETATGKLLEQGEGTPLDAGEGFLDDAFVHYVSGANDTVDIEVWSWRERKRVGLLENTGADHFPCTGGRFCVAQRLDPVRGQAGKWGVWSLRPFWLEAEFQTEAAELSPRAMAENGQWLAMTCKGEAGNYLELRELPSGKQIATAPVREVTAMYFSPDGRFLFLDGMEDESTCCVLETPTLKVAWATGATRMAQFSRDGRTVFACDWDIGVVVGRELRTGAPKIVAGLSVAGIAMSTIPVSDRRVLLVHQATVPDLGPPRPLWLRWLDWIPVPARPNDMVIVLDTDNCREQFRLRGLNIPSSLLSNNGKTLVTVHKESDDRRVIRCWDVNAYKPLRWAVGVPAGLGALGVLLAWWRGRRAMVKNAAGG